ncbi:ferredoxin [Mycolicibacterium sp.]|uniref:ferredoxin n=1 Tax=Mycolicibacterium sp. TaxID=2320850 RepID=UPI003D0C0BA2
MRLRVDPTKCRGYAICLELAPEQFSADDWGLVQAYGTPVSTSDVAAGQRAIDACPYQAIQWVDGNSRSPRLRLPLVEVNTAQVVS